MPPTATTRYELYKDDAGEYRFRLVCVENGEPIAASTEGYTDRRDAEHAIELVRNSKESAVHDHTD